MDDIQEINQYINSNPDHFPPFWQLNAIVQMGDSYITMQYNEMYVTTYEVMNKIDLCLKPKWANQICSTICYK